MHSYYYPAYPLMWDLYKIYMKMDKLIYIPEIGITPMKLKTRNSRSVNSSPGGIAPAPLLDNYYY